MTFALATSPVAFVSRNVAFILDLSCNVLLAGLRTLPTGHPEPGSNRRDSEEARELGRASDRRRSGCRVTGQLRSGDPAFLFLPVLPQPTTCLRGGHEPSLLGWCDPDGKPRTGGSGGPGGTLLISTLHCCETSKCAQEEPWFLSLSLSFLS